MNCTQDYKTLPCHPVKLSYLLKNIVALRGGVRIMDLDQYLEKMNTNTKII